MPRKKEEQVEELPVEEAKPSEISAGLFQAWASIAAWMSFGLLLEGLIGYRIPGYVNDEMRRELFRLAHSHGALLNIILLLVVICVRMQIVTASKIALWALRIGVIMMPVGFMLGGIWHTESEPGIGIFLAPLGGIMVIFGVISVAISALQKK